MALIQFENVSVNYGAPSHAVLSNIDLKIEEGEFVSLVGPSGCGKSTLLNMIAGLDTASAGSVRGKHSALTAAPIESPHSSIVYRYSSPRPGRSTGAARSGHGLSGRG